MKSYLSNWFCVITERVFTVRYVLRLKKELSTERQTRSLVK